MARWVHFTPSMTTLDASNKPPPRTVVLSGSTLSRVDVGLTISFVARSIWNQIEERAGLVIELDSWGPVVADDTLLKRLLQSMVLEVIDGVPPGAPELHVLSLAARAGPDETLAIDVRHRMRGGASVDGFSKKSELEEWDHQAKQFAARVEAIDSPPEERCYRVMLQLAI